MEAGLFRNFKPRSQKAALGLSLNFFFTMAAFELLRKLR